MRQFFLIAFVGFVIIHSKAQENKESRYLEVDIEFKLDGYKKDTILLGYHYGDQKFVQDTLIGRSGSFQYIKSEVHPGLYFLYDKDFYIEFILNESKFTLKTDGTFDNYVSKGSKENEVFKSFQSVMTDAGTKRKEYQELFKNAESPEDSSEIISRIRNLNQETIGKREGLINGNSDLLVSKLFKLLQPVPYPDVSEIDNPALKQKVAYLAYKEAYLESIDFEEKGLIRTPAFKRKVLEYLKGAIFQHPDSISIEIDRILSIYERNEDKEGFRFLLINVTNHYAKSKAMGMDAVYVHLIEDYYLSGKVDWIPEENLESMRKSVASLKPNLVGSPAPALNLVDVTLTPKNALDILNDKKYLLLYFFDPDCGHCKKTTPKIEKIYGELQDLDTEVVAIATITDVERWREYVDENQFPWLNLADPNTQSNFRFEYNIRSTPQVYLINSDRKIIAKKIKVEDVPMFLERYNYIYQ